jgi:hypothetical protein
VDRVLPASVRTRARGVRRPSPSSGAQQCRRPPPACCVVNDQPVGNPKRKV